MKEQNIPKCSVIVSSCDSYDDVWAPFFTLFFRYWPDCPFPVYLMSETKKYPDDRVTTINIGEDKKWASNMKTALKQINTPYVLYLQEDYFFRSKVDTDNIIKLLNYAIREKVGCLRLFPSPGPDRTYKNSADVGEIDKKANYSISTQATIWNKDVLDSLLIDGESGWDFEIKGSKKVVDLKIPFLCVYKKAINYFATAIKRGVWYYDAVKLCAKEGIIIDGKRREIETRSRYFLRVSRLYSFYEKMNRLFSRITRKLSSISFLPFNLLLTVKKFKQRADFNSLKEEFFDLYKTINKKDISKFTTSHWEKTNKSFDDFLKNNGVPFGFLRNKIIGYTMFISNEKAMNKEMELLENKYSETELKKYLAEESVGFPILLNRKYVTSHNSIHHLYHLCLFLGKTKSDIDAMNTVVEWGGGYGNLAKIFLRLRGETRETTYVIIDTPLFSSLQWLYLSVVLGKDKINVIKKGDDKIVFGKINIVPLGFVDKVNIKPDLFISTWALSESSVYSQNYVLEKDFFGAEHILIGYQDSHKVMPDSDRIITTIGTKRADFMKEDILFLPGNHYVFV